MSEFQISHRSCLGGLSALERCDASGSTSRKTTSGGTVGRPKLPITSADISAEIARVQHESQAQLRQLEERRRVAETRENQRRGELIMTYLNRSKGDELRALLHTLVDQTDRSLFALDDSLPRNTAD